MAAWLKGGSVIFPWRAVGHSPCLHKDNILFEPFLCMYNKVSSCLLRWVLNQELVYSDLPYKRCTDVLGLHSGQSAFDQMLMVFFNFHKTNLNLRPTFCPSWPM